MRSTILCLQAIWLFAVTMMCGCTLAEDNSHLRGRMLEEGPVHCTLFLEVGIPESGNEPEDEAETWYCVDLKDEVEYSLSHLPDKFFEDEHLISGVTVVEISSATISDQTNSTTDTSGKPSIRVNNGGRVWTSTPTSSAVTNKREGNKTVLVVRVTDGVGDDPTMSATQISDAVFGTGNDRVNLVSQYHACSGGKLVFQPAAGDNITDGVMEVTIDEKVSNVDRSVVQGWVTEEVQNVLGEDRWWDFVMYVFPSSVDFRGAGAYASLGGIMSVYKDYYVGTLLVHMHEVGHNLGMSHSGYDSKTYGDKTCFEGAHLYADETPVMCFNAAKSWYLGWYNDTDKVGHEIVSPSIQSFAGRLVGIHEYIHNKEYDSTKNRVILKISTKNEDDKDHPDLYVMYNRKQGINKGVQAFGDTVQVVSQFREEAAQSWLEAALDDDDGTDTYRLDNFDETGLTLVVKVCNLRYRYPHPDNAEVIVYLENGGHDLDCDTAFSSTTITWF